MAKVEEYTVEMIDSAERLERGGDESMAILKQRIAEEFFLLMVEECMVMTETTTDEDRYEGLRRFNATLSMNVPGDDDNN